MLIDARHREETRVAVVKGNRIEEFDFESAERKQLKGNIYLAKVTRVEPSLQAAFIDYGGNRHGFLAFSEIHPDYYQIPKEDREALLREEAEHAAQEAALRAELDAEDDEHEEELDADHDHDHGDDDHADDVQEPSEDDIERLDDDGAPDEEVAAGRESRGRRRRGNAGSDDQVEALRQRRMNLRRRYKIEDVIKRRQVLLVQVVKEERGNKGAALTTYLSLAGRYCVLMPNTSHGGGISRKISNAGDRKRLKSIMADLKLPPSMGCIVRTAGLQRTKVEIKRDFDYLARLWDGIRETTLASSAPALVYGDSDLIKRAIRDIYNKDIDEVVVEGDEGYRHAKEFMKLLMPSHARRVKHYSDAVPLFQRAHVEEQLAAMYHPVVQLKSGGYLVINPTEALVSIDINSGRSTRERSIEQTATATNLEAAAEIARQLRLRDMAGLVVIDFIDMDNGSNVRKVEKAMKEALKNDRARIQVGRISSFGLMEMSRQRLRTGVLEASTRACPHCEGTGLVRTASSAGLSALRLIEDEAARGRGSILTLRASQEATIYVLNKKRADIAEIEDRYGVQVVVLPDGETEGARMSVEASGPPPAYQPKFAAVVEEEEDDIVEEDFDEEAEAEDDEREARGGEGRERSGDDGKGRGKRRRRRRGRRGRGRPEGEEGGETAERSGDDEAEGESEGEFVGEQPVEASDDGGEPRRRRRRGRRGRRGEAGGETAGGDAAADTAGDATPEAADAGDAGAVLATHANPDVPVAVEPDAAEAEAPKRTRRRPRARVADEAVAEAPVAAPEPAAEAAAAVTAEAPAKPKRTRKKVAPATEVAAPEPAVTEEAPAVAEAAPAEAPAKPRRSRKKAEAAPAPANDAALTPAVDADGAAPADDAAAGTAEPAEAADAAEPRRGWWQRTFGA
ncbi:MAG: ribonuclease E/G [Sphingomonas sp.]|uniref:Rne/Rng family ribonuclease n=1 Tax=Sphingomonas sp. TaxID=28214 RepID=UPI001AC0A068|nr:ribonuclease E/G [Sphingomonas sp.]MBN8807903.1 ribonuclease E/G [Sphingomonas sp.]